MSDRQIYDPISPLRWINWRKRPFLRLVLPIIAGIGLASYTDFAYWHWLWVAVIIGLVSLTLLATRRLIADKRHPYIFGVGLLLFNALLGYTIAAATYGPNHPAHFSHHAQDAYWRLEVEQVSTTARWYRVYARVLGRIDSTGLLHHSKGNLLLYLAPDPRAEALEPGARLLISGTPEPIRAPLNPLAFSFKSYYRGQNIHHQLFLRDSLAWQPLSVRRFSLIRMAQRVRNACLDILGHHLTGDTYAVGAALVLGHRNDLTTSLRNAYVDTGAIHVLAVSGLHVGYIAAALIWVFGLRRWQGWRHWRRLATLLTIVGIFAYAFVTGLSASVVRASIMIALALIGRLFYRTNYPFNILALTAFVMLLYNPFYLFQVGFILSFLAVGGILFFQRHLQRLLYIRWAPLRYLWSLVTVSLAAQLATLPVTLYAFHQFPLYFMLSGIVVVIGAGLVLAIGLATLVVSAALPILPWISSALGWLLHQLIGLMNAGVYYIQQLPGGKVEGVWLDAWMLVLLFISIGLLGRWLIDRNALTISGALFALALLLAWRALDYYQHTDQQRITIYHLKGSSLIDIFDGRQLYTLTSTPIPTDAINRAASNWRSSHRVLTAKQLQANLYEGLDTLNCLATSAAFGYRGQRWGILGPASPLLGIPVHGLLVQHDPPHDPEWVLRQQPPTQIVIDGSNGWFTARRWERACEAAGVAYHHTARQGAYCWPDQ